MSKLLEEVPTARYLVVMHRTRVTAELIAHLRHLLAEDPTTDFALLVPATPAGGWLTWDEAESQEVARRRTSECRQALEHAGIRPSSVHIGEWALIDAVVDEIGRVQNCNGIILSGFASAALRLLRMDATSRLRRQFPDLRIFDILAPRNCDGQGDLRRLTDSLP